ncbi:MAG: SUF system Fe-S cluster assembly protein [Rhodospirillales bacterium]
MGFEHTAEASGLSDLAVGRASSFDQVARAGEPLPPGDQPASSGAVIEALRTVYDPEIPVNIYDLGLIYTLDIAEDGSVAVDMTLTAPACPVAGELPMQVAEAVSEVDGIGEVSVRLVWDPPWSTELMSEDAKMALGMFS